MQGINVTFTSERPGGDIELEGRLHLPNGGGTSPGVLLCHPHPMGGGSMDVGLIHEIAGLLQDGGCVALRFNFGGVGGSEGVFSGGVEEPADVRAGLNYLETVDGVRKGEVSVVGWSFGAWMVLLSACDGLPARTLVAIAPPLMMYEWQDYPERLVSSETGRKYIVGEDDRFCPPDTIRSFAGEISGDDLANITVLAGADHFLMGREHEIALLVRQLVGKMTQ